jgi:hypothetical protein
MILAVLLSVAQELGGLDPVTLLQWKEACRLVEAREAEIWPGYRLGELPLLVLHPGVAEALVRHPLPPAGFERVKLPAGEGELGVLGTALGDEPLFLRRGTTTFPSPMDTTEAIGGITTLVVTDRGARGESDDAWNLAVMVHEGFHAWASRHVKAIAASPLDVLEWPDLDARVNAHLELEGVALLAAIGAARAAGADARADEIEEQSLLFLAERLRRRAHLPPAAIRWEDENEQNEGLASYAEWRAYELWSEHGVGEELARALPKLKSAAFRARADGMANMLGHSARGSLSINGSSFGPGAVRRRGYFFGAAQGLLLDRLLPEWKHEAERGRALTELLREALGEPEDSELAHLADEHEAGGFAALVAKKEQQLVAARAERERRIAAVLEGIGGAGTLVVIDVSALSPSGALSPSSWNPFGVLRVDEHRRLFSQTATRFDFGAAAHLVTAPDVAVIADEQRRELVLRSPTGVDALVEALSKWSGRFADAAVTIEAPAASAAPFMVDDVRGVRLLLKAR